MPDLASRLPVLALAPISRVAKPLALALATASLFLYPGCAGTPRSSSVSRPSGAAIAPVSPSRVIEGLTAPLMIEPITAVPALDTPIFTPIQEPAVALEPLSAASAPAPEAPTASEPVVAPAESAPAPTVTGRGTPYDPEIERWRPLIRQELAQAGAEGLLSGPAARLDEDLLLAMIEQESGGDPSAESWAGAMGLLQLMPGTFAGLMFGDWNLSLPRDTILDPTLNVRAGVRYMADALQIHGGNLYWSVSSYNAGSGATQDWLSVGLPAVPPVGGYWETAAYAPAILSNYAAHRPDVSVYIPARITEDQIPGIVALLTNAGLW